MVLQVNGITSMCLQILYTLKRQTYYSEYSDFKTFPTKDNFIRNFFFNVIFCQFVYVKLKIIDWHNNIFQVFTVLHM